MTNEELLARISAQGDRLMDAFAQVHNSEVGGVDPNAALGVAARLIAIVAIDYVKHYTMEQLLQVVSAEAPRIEAEMRELLKKQVQ